MPVAFLAMMLVIMAGACTVVLAVWLLRQDGAVFGAHKRVAELDEVKEAIEDLRDGMQSVRSDMNDFDERLEFAERLLSQPSEGGALPGGR